MSVRPVEDSELLERLEKRRRRRSTFKLSELERDTWYETDLSAITIYAKARKEGVTVTVRKAKDKVYFKIIGE